MKPVTQKNIATIGIEWDEVCLNRHKAIVNGKDISLTHVIEPAICAELKKAKYCRLLDVGCGTGYLTNQMKRFVDNCVGIDVSRTSIMIARKYYEKTGLSFRNIGMTDISVKEYKFDVCVSSMALMSDPCCCETIKQIWNVFDATGTLFILLTHPCFWPIYWGINNQEWFDYKNEVYIEHDFSISLVKSMGKATYIHRPLEYYLSAVTKANFSISEVKELYPVGELPENYTYRYPRFLMIVASKQL
jgi:ubiquinone/menaquinone biosynthesis C-methylase UbiE